ncbi:MAG: serine protein kinase RIO [Candidatus Hadarchaeales archaeon]
MAELLRRLERGKPERLEKDSEFYKILERVFDHSTLLSLYGLVKRGVIDVFHGVVSTGKEANVFCALDPCGQYLAVKIYRTATTDFKRKFEYISADPRFHGLRRDRRAVVYAWVTREVKNLQRAHEAGVRAPRPVAFAKNILVMEFIGEEGVPYPRMVDQPPASPKRVFEMLVEDMKRLYGLGRLVHADLSEYNVLLTPDPVMIDFSMATDVANPASKGLLMRDVEKVLNYFGKLGLKLPTPQQLFEEIEASY